MTISLACSRNSAEKITNSEISFENKLLALKRELCIAHFGRKERDFFRQRDTIRNDVDHTRQDVLTGRPKDLRVCDALEKLNKC